MKKHITSILRISVKNKIYDEKVNPILLSYFISGAKDIIIYNQSSNVFSRLEMEKIHYV